MKPLKLACNAILFSNSLNAQNDCFHSHLEFSSTFLMLTSNKNIDKIESLQKKAIRLLMGLPRISHTAEAFWALNILPIRKLGIFNVIKYFALNYN